MRLVRLGLRLSRGAGRGGWMRLGLVAFGTAVTAFVVLSALGLGSLAERQPHRAATISPRYGESSPLHGVVIPDGWKDRALERVVLATDKVRDPLPPGVDALPNT